VSDIADLLRAARALLEPEGAWCQGAYALTDDGHTTMLGAPNCVQRCAIAALHEAYPLERPVRESAFDNAWFLLAEAMGVRVSEVEGWNDVPGRTQAEVLDAFERAIASAEREDAHD
jgi:hypothetical protein